MQRAATLMRHATQIAAARRTLRATNTTAAGTRTPNAAAPGLRSFTAATASPLACALHLGARWRGVATPASSASSPLFGVRRHMSSSSGASGAAAGAGAGAGAAGSSGAAGTGAGAAATGAVDPTVAASMFNKATAAVASGPAPVVDAAPTVGTLLGGDELTSLYPALDPDSWLHIIPAWFQSGLELIHAQTGLPWVGSIMLTILAARAMMLPLHVMQAKASSGSAAAMPELLKLKEAYAAVAAQYARIGQVVPLKLKMEHDAAMAEVNARYGANYRLLKVLGPGIMSAPLFISFFVAIRAMGHVDPTFCTGGVLWFPNLAELDATYALPFINACTIALTAWVNSRFVVTESTAITRFMTKFMYVMAVCSLPFSALNMPAGVIIYWITNGCILMAQGFLLRNKSVMKILGIPERPPPAPKAGPVTPGSVVNAATLTPEQKAEAEKIRFYQMKRELKQAQRSGAAAATPAAVTAPLNPFAPAAASSSAGDLPALRAALRSSSSSDTATAAPTAAAAAPAAAASVAQAVKALPVQKPVVKPAAPQQNTRDNRRGRR